MPVYVNMEKKLFYVLMKQSKMDINYKVSTMCFGGMCTWASSGA